MAASNDIDRSATSRTAGAVAALALAGALGAAWSRGATQDARALEAPTPAVRAGLVAGRVDFASEVLPILAANCFRCHGGVREMAGLNLSDPARVKSVLRSGKFQFELP
ncbi:MAG: hypothetical protein ACO3QC_06500 [Phycisphaerales bacterium]